MKHLLVTITEHAIILIDVLVLVIILWGTIEAFFGCVRLVLSSSTDQEKRDVWLRYASWLIAGLTFQLAADILETSITTSWDAVGRIAVIAVVRTFLNYFLERDLAEMNEKQRRTGKHALA